MPNWCSNTLNISHEDPAMIERAKTAYKAGRLLEEFVPFPNGEWDYNWCVNAWGTKWDVGGEDAHMVEQDANGVVFNFDSAWAPPTSAYEQLMEQGSVWSKRIIGFAHQHRIWDYASANLQRLRDANSEARVHRLRLGYHRELERVPSPRTDNEGFLFYGSI